MLHIEDNFISNSTQLPLWPDDEMPEMQQSTQDVQEKAAPLSEVEPSATQLYLPGFELK